LNRLNRLVAKGSVLKRLTTLLPRAAAAPGRPHRLPWVEKSAPTFSIRWYSRSTPGNGKGFLTSSH